MLKRNCVVKYMDEFGIEHAVKVEAGTLFEAAILGLQRLDSSFGAEMWDRMSITVEISAEPTTYAAMIQKLKPWIQSEVSRPQEEGSPGVSHCVQKTARKVQRVVRPTRAKAPAAQFRICMAQPCCGGQASGRPPWNAG